MPVGLSLFELLALIPAGGALVAPVLTSAGGAVFVLPAGATAVDEDHLLWLDDFTSDSLSELLDDWFTAYRGNSQDAWLNTIETVGRSLWDSLLGPVHERLRSQGVGEGAPVLLMPQGGLGLLPLHAAWREDEGKRRAFLDDYVVTYVPSGYALSVSHKRLRKPQPQQRSLLAVVNPTADLAFASIEGETLAALFPVDARKILPEAEATKPSLKQAAPGRTYLHFCCHGFYDWRDAMHSGLRLAGGTTLTLAEIIESLDLDASCLAALSACETGLTELRESPDEHLGLPAGFLQAGAPAVVSSLWAVDDPSTAILMREFYRLHLNKGYGIGVALRAAQLWLRSATARQMDLAQLWERICRRATGRFAQEAFEKMWYYREHPDDQPFAHPFHWAAFTAAGAT